jgi:hypothetical protein
MDVDKVREVVKFALENLHGEPVRVKALGNRVHLYAGDEEFEIVIRTMTPKGSSRLDRRPLDP